MFDATDILEGGESGVVSGVAEGCGGVHISSWTRSLTQAHTRSMEAARNCPGGWKAEACGTVAFWNRPVEMVVRTFLDTEGRRVGFFTGKKG